MSANTDTRTSKSNTIATLTRRSFLTALGAGAAMVGCASSGETTDTTATSDTASSGSNPADTSALALDSAAWGYDKDNDVYYQIGVQYCANPAATDYESMGIYVPGAYFSGTENGDGTYTCSVKENGAVGAYTAATAPIVLPVNTAGYSAQAAPTEYSSQGASDYLAAGLIYVEAGCRGRDNGENPDGTSFAGGAPWGVTDLKAAIRAIRYNAALLPGDKGRIFTFGHSGGGAQSALVGATGDADLYTPYLESIGAAFTDADGTKLSDAICGAMCWCPITCLDQANGAYEWMMGQYATSGTREDGTWTALLSDDLAATYASYINTCNFETEDSGVLTLSEGGEGLFSAGPYYEHLLSVVEGSLNNYLSDTEFPYTPSSGGMGGGMPGGGAPSGAPSGEMPSGGAPSGEAPSGAPSGGMPGGSSDSSGAPTGTAPSGEAPSGAMAGGPTGSDSSGDSCESTTYEDAQAYIDHLNASEEWVSYDASTNTATVSSLAAFARNCKSATKDVGAFDKLDLSSAENKLFGTSGSDALHFDATMAKLLADNADEYAAASNWDEAYVEDYAAGLKSVDDLGTDSPTRQNLYNPLYFLSGAYKGYGTSTPAPHWRIRTGIEQGDTSLTTEVNLALALSARKDVTDVDFETVWEQGHTTAERTGSSTENLLSWIESCK